MRWPRLMAEKSRPKFGRSVLARMPRASRTAAVCFVGRCVQSFNRLVAARKRMCVKSLGAAPPTPPQSARDPLQG